VPERAQEKQTMSWKRFAVEALLDNVRSIHNVGSMFRTADGVGLAHLHLCGMTATPAHAKLSKAALGAQEKVPWSYSANGLDTAVSLKEQGCRLWAIEASENAQPFFAAEREPPNSRVIVVVGNEIAGVDPGILEISDRVFSLPMYGFKRSLNVAVAFGIVMYHLRYALQLQLPNG
jgi:tRNA G18 (ribose-2'-O)-methylase SpoU